MSGEQQVAQGEGGCTGGQGVGDLPFTDILFGTEGKPCLLYTSDAADE